MAAAEKPSSQLQFALRDLLMIVLASAIWVAIWPPFSEPRSFDDQFLSTFRHPLWACVAALVVVLFSSASALILTASTRIDAHTRSGWLALALFIGPFLALSLISSVTSSIRVDTSAQFAKGRIEALAMGQEAYHLDHHEYSPSIASLEPYLSHPIGSWTEAEGLPGQPGVKPIDGYVFRVLKAQGPRVPGGRKSYMVVGVDGRERMTDGFAIIAIPVSGDRGITFMVAKSRHLVGKALGPKAAQIASQITEFDPDESWIDFRR